MNLDKEKKDILKEIANIGAGNAATAFSTMVDQKIDITVPRIELMPIEDLPEITGDQEDYISCTLINFEGEISGKILLVLEMQVVEKVLHLLFREGELPEDEIQNSALRELGNILSGAYLKAINIFSNLNLSQGLPAVAYDMAGAVLSSSVIDFNQSDDEIILLETEFIISDEKLELYYFFIPEEESIDIFFQHLMGDNLD
ncbi:chemotaxis protein CheC [Halanaerobium congolense]|jgi:chemotaxis protein CheC|uniref:Chemotaxis protein CheC n=1 Tax=Halanaerobium congolense TaxID=54121 RepID=A0A1G6S3E0_9FIRM|nr:MULTISPECIES: chemotaxis protein CheC [Halanaerobium]KXS49976.1 MAG: Chemotaxis protein CheC--inhibitor of MCP methylation [Halanaerobium sp. T82-1]PTX16501.1 chemotaxis protein CheC [Halanaerobium congolense]PUU90910.1 MAG: Chemotaxis protein CheC--inhibitor of MCP methylation [Halanaerobium sp.]PUU92833.1 MAG: Chemotaxis protein CheC--inhibitor of MCP methylation [Halanaerobium sp.]TDP26360.1 chemotaxis protein CheC [Halanaerobium congolense]